MHSFSRRVLILNIKSHVMLPPQIGAPTYLIDQSNITLFGKSENKDLTSTEKSRNWP